MIKVVLGLGSNARYKNMNSLEILAAACARLKTFLSDCVFSSVYETKPMYYENQNNFFNMVAMGTVPETLSPYSLLDKIHEIENEFGRNRACEERYGARSLDIDIEEFGDLQINTPNLILPHPKMTERQFVLVPLLEILENSADINNREKVFSLLKSLPDQGVWKCSDVVQKEFNTLLKT